MYSKLFKFDEKGNIVPLSIRESQIDCVKEILRADTGSPGDSDGRKKLYAHKVISACCWIGDPNSLGNQQGYVDDGLRNDAIRNCGLPDNWKPTKYAKDLISIIATHYEGGVAKSYVMGMLRSMNSIIKTSEIICARVDKTIYGDIDMSDEKLNVLASMQTRLLSMASEAPKHVAALKQAIADLKVEEDEAELALGGKVVDFSMRVHD